MKGVNIDIVQTNKDRTGKQGLLRIYKEDGLGNGEELKDRCERAEDTTASRSTRSV